MVVDFSSTNVVTRLSVTNLVPSLAQAISGVGYPETSTVGFHWLLSSSRWEMASSSIFSDGTSARRRNEMFRIHVRRISGFGTEFVS